MGTSPKSTNHLPLQLKKVHKGAFTTTVRMMMKSHKNVLLKAEIDLLYDHSTLLFNDDVLGHYEFLLGSTDGLGAIPITTRPSPLLYSPKYWECKGLLVMP